MPDIEFSIFIEKRLLNVLLQDECSLFAITILLSAPQAVPDIIQAKTH